MAAYALVFSASSRSVEAVQLGDLRNLLQVTASALHLLELQLDSELRPLIQIGLAALRQAAETANLPPASAAVHYTRSISQ
jgi:hypothetical protein